jgi:hypothetical protein
LFFAADGAALLASLHAASAAATAMRSKADVSDRRLQHGAGYAAVSAASSAATSVAGDGADDPARQMTRSSDVLESMLDSDMSWGFVRELQKVPALPASVMNCYKHGTRVPHSVEHYWHATTVPVHCNSTC